MKKLLQVRFGQGSGYWMWIALFLGIPLHAQQYFTAEQSYGIKLGTTKPLYESYAYPPTDKEKLEEQEENKPQEVPNFFGRHQIAHNPNALPSGNDPLYDPSHLRMPGYDILPIVNVEGIPESSVNISVPDVNGDVGRDYFVQIVNASFFKVYNKSGQSVSLLISANSIWSQIGQSSFSDPVLLYDQEVDRWMLAEIGAGGGNNKVLVAISKTGDPRAEWDAYLFTTPRLPDFEKFGIWADAYYMTTNETGPNFPFYAFNREDMLAGADIVRMQRLTVPKIGGAGFEVAQPVDWDGLTRPPVGSPGLAIKINDDDWGTTTTDEIQIHKISINWDDVNSSNVEILKIPTAAFDTDGCQLENTGGFSCVPQPNNQGIDGAEWIISNRVQYRNFGDHEAFVMCFMVDVNGQDVAGVRWMEFRRTAPDDWYLYQEGTVGSDDGIHRFMGAIGIDGNGDIGLGYAVSGYAKNPSLRYTGRFSSDPPGMMTFNEYEFMPGTGSLGADRFGDYFAMCVDPADDATFWFTGEYVKNGGNWFTRIVSFNAGRDTLDLLPVNLDSPVSSVDLGSNEPVTITILNRGLRTAYDFTVAFQFNGGSWVTEEAHVDSLLVDHAYQHTFSSTVSFPTAGFYTIKIATGLDLDDNKLNDTLSFLVNKIAHRNIGIEYVPQNAGDFICSDHTMADIILRNLGVDTLTSILFELDVNNDPPVAIEWIGSLPYGVETVFQIPVGNLHAGKNTIALHATSVNGTTDEIPGNNDIGWIYNARPDGESLTLHFTTDNFPSESSWKLFDDQQNLVASGQGFTQQQHTYESMFCLNKEACYTFTVYDAFGDGMSAQGVQGDYTITNEAGDVVSELARPNFGAQISSTFCFTDACMFSLNIGVQHESSPGAADGMVMGEPVNPLGPVQYSLDGGQHFQAGNIFSNLPAGQYELIAHDGAGCADTVSFAIISCSLQALIETIPAIGGDVGEIHIHTSGGMGEISFSLNEGEFTSDSIYTMLEPGNYIIMIRDTSGCQLTDTVTVSTMVSTIIPANEQYISITPNPGNGLYEVQLGIPSSQLFIPYVIYTSSGEPIQYGQIGRYGDFYKTEIAILTSPRGIYYFSFNVGAQSVIRKVIKSE